MGFMDKVMFWKKDEMDFDDLDKGMDFGSGQDFGMGQDRLNMGASQAPGMESGELGLQTQQQNPPMQTQDEIDYSEGFSMPKRSITRREPVQPSPTPTQQFPQEQNTISEKNFEILSNKLDSIKSSLESINHRLNLLESFLSPHIFKCFPIISNAFN